MDNVKCKNEKKRGLEGKHYVEKKRIKTIRTVNNKPKNMRCPCGGGQSCIVDRRWIGDWVHEDNVFLRNSLPLRKNCFAELNLKQHSALHKSMTISSD